MSTTLPDPTKPLAGMRVLELSQIMAGPICGLMLGDLGAEVIKIEKFPGGDDARAFSSAGAANTMPASFQMINRGKKSVALNLKSQLGRDTLLKMVQQADVVTENYRPGALKRLGLAPEDLIKANPKLIVVSVSGYGSIGPLSDRGGFDLVLQAFSGLISVTGEEGGGSVKPGVPTADINSGVLAALGTLSAYIYRLRTGQGQWVQTSLLQASMQQLYWQAALFFASGAMPKRLGTAHPLIAPYQTFACADGELAIGGGNATIWKKLLEVLEKPQWDDDARFNSSKNRLDNRPALEALMNDVLRTHTRAYWEEKLLAAGVPCGPVQNVAEALNHPQTHALNMVVDAENANGGSIRSLGLPILFNGTNSPSLGAAPQLGQHTQEVLSAWGVSPEEYALLVKEQACMQA